MSYCEVGDFRLHFQQQGSGPDVILIHGVTGDLSIWFLCRAIQILSRDHRVTCYDLRGHGYSDAPKTSYTSADHMEDLFNLMDRLEISTAQFVGHSFGAVVAMHLAADHPDRVRSLVLSDPYFPALRHLEDLSRWGHWQNFRTEAEAAGVMLAVEHWYDLGQFFDQIQGLDSDRLLKLRQAVGLPGLNRLLRLSKTTCGNDSKLEAGLTTERIQTVTVPTLALYGEHSPFRSTADYLVAHLRDCRLELVPGAQHRAPEENPEMFLAALTQFLQDVDSEPAESGTHG